MCGRRHRYSVRHEDTPSADAAHDRRREVVVVGRAALVEVGWRVDSVHGAVDLLEERVPVRVVARGTVRGVGAG